MKYKSLAIALTYIKQGETSIISKILTKEKGLQTFIIKGVRSKNSKKKLSFFEPLNLLNIDAKYNNNKAIQFIEELTVAKKINYNSEKMHRKFIAFFIAEINGKVLQVNEQNNSLFNFIWDISEELFTCKEIDSNFAIRYLLNLSRFLGFYPSLDTFKKPFFNLESGNFSEKNDSLKIFIDAQKTIYLKSIIQKIDVVIPQKIKSELLRDLLKYYKINNYNLDSITSHLVIESLR
jgi:DNA repair protein RecO (recombination protein O)